STTATLIRQECRAQSPGHARMGADWCRAPAPRVDRPRKRGCGESQSRPVEALRGAVAPTEPKRRNLGIEFDARCEKAHPHPMRRSALNWGANGLSYCSTSRLCFLRLYVMGMQNKVSLHSLA